MLSFILRFGIMRDETAELLYAMKLADLDVQLHESPTGGWKAWTHDRFGKARTAMGSTDDQAVALLAQEVGFEQAPVPPRVFG